VLVFSTGSISGGNLNPAVTLSLFVTRKMSLLRCVCYILAQCAGAVAGAMFVRSLSPGQFELMRGAANIVSLKNRFFTPWTAVGGEMLGTGLLVFTICAAADVGREKDNKYVGALTPLNIGFAVLVAHLALLNVDGCSINPARSFGSAVAGDQWENHYVFWVGPLVGGPVTAIMYELVFKAGRDDPDGSASAREPGAESTTFSSGSSRALGGAGGAAAGTPSLLLPHGSIERDDSIHLSNASLIEGGQPPTPPIRGQPGGPGAPFSGRALQVLAASGGGSSGGGGGGGQASAAGQGAEATLQAHPIFGSQPQHTPLFAPQQAPRPAPQAAAPVSFAPLPVQDASNYNGFSRELSGGGGDWR
jgi:aquaporin PIP